MKTKGCGIEVLDGIDDAERNGAAVVEAGAVQGAEGWIECQHDRVYSGGSGGRRRWRNHSGVMLHGHDASLSPFCHTDFILSGGLH